MSVEPYDETVPWIEPPVIAAPQLPIPAGLTPAAGQLYGSTGERIEAKPEPNQALLTELKRQAEVNHAEFSALCSLEERMRQRSASLFTGWMFLLGLEGAVLLLTWQYGFSHDLPRYFLLPLSVLLLFFIALATRGYMLARALNQAIRDAKTKQTEALIMASRVLEEPSYLPGQTAGPLREKTRGTSAESPPS